MAGGVDVTVSGAGQAQLVALTHRLREAGEQGKGLRRELLAGIRVAVKPVLDDVRVSAVEVLPKRGGLAARVAGSHFAVSSLLSGNNARVRVVGKSGYNIAAMNRGRLRHPVFDTKLRHPVFGTTKVKVWVTQSVTPGWFDDPVRKAADAGMRDAVLAVVDSVSRKVTP